MALPHVRRVPATAVKLTEPRIPEPSGSWAIYSSHRIESVTCLRLSSRCTRTQSGPASRRCPAWCHCSKAGLRSRVRHLINGQVRAAKAANRRSVALSRGRPSRRAISLRNPGSVGVKSRRMLRACKLSPAGSYTVKEAHYNAARRALSPAHPGDIPRKHGRDSKSEPRAPSWTRWATSFWERRLAIIRSCARSTRAYSHYPAPRRF